ncbi:GAF and ANTAR domain-containing protein [Nocardioides panacis]|uniref:GAF and ANTAR domain-containing protein n=1 Tax=Nocardioides panacis TaxID=2849501 RepID=A0A975Y1W5_9ACTN|nr:GAF and ANTAR domain-containing protein [Nocardioides panacis]QWZ09938.1 GAF and ANTAR domain-containing protein [Nocardioides panacis]
MAEILAGVLDDTALSANAPHRLVTACARALPVTGVGIILMTLDGPAGTLAVTDGPAATMEELQFTLGEGPCVECSATGRPVLQPDLEATGTSRWPAFTAGAVEAGIRAIFAFPLRVGSIRLGVLDLYRDTPGDLDMNQLREALSFADAATAVLLHSAGGPSPDGSNGRPGQDATRLPMLEDHAEVHQATGMVSVQADVSMAEALVRLRARAYASERPVVTVARDVLDGLVTFDGQ